jgi:photosystem II PsbX protein
MLINILSQPLSGQNPMTPSLANFLLSILAGVLIVVIPATVGLLFLSQRDKIQRQ